MGKNVKHMRWWPRPWEYDKAQAWLTEQARLGWRLKSIGLVFAKFTREDPADLRYRCILHDNSMLPGEEKTLMQAYLDGGWKYIGYKSNKKVFVTEAEGATADPTDPERQQQLARKRTHAKIIWIIVSALLYAAGFCLLNLDSSMYLSITLTRQISLFLITLWFVNYWLSSLRELVLYYKTSKPHAVGIVETKPAKVATVLWGIHFVLLILLLAPGPYYPFKKFIEKRITAPSISVSEIVEASQAAYRIKEDRWGYAEEGYGILYPYRRIEYGSADVIPQGNGVDDADLSVFTVVHYKALFRSGAQRLGERLCGHVYFISSYVAMDKPVSPMVEGMGFDRLWKYDDEWEHIVVAVKGTDVFYIIFEGPLSSDQLALFLINKITDEQEDPAP